MAPTDSAEEPEAMGERLPDWPTAVSASGNKFLFDDAQQRPDMLTVKWDFPGATLTYKMRNWQPNPIEGEAERTAVYGENGYAVIGNGTRRAFDDRNKIVAPCSSPKSDDLLRKRDMLAAIRDRGAAQMRHRDRALRLGTGPPRKHRLADGPETSIRSVDRDFRSRLRCERPAGARVPAPVAASEGLIPAPRSAPVRACRDWMRKAALGRGFRLFR